MSQSTNKENPWSPWHNRLHKSLKIKKDLLPFGSNLLLSISGGQDSMVLLKLITDLQRLYKWKIHIWHGNHGWHKESLKIAKELEQWCCNQGFNFEYQNAITEKVSTEEAGRNWRYQQLLEKAKLISTNNLPCEYILTGHTASDQTETLIMNLARGAYLAGLSSLKESRKLENRINLIRPLLIFSRKETYQICKEFHLPIWVDPSNHNLKFHRNRVRHEIIPVLEDMHPGSSKRISSLAEKLALLKKNQDALTNLALETIKNKDNLFREEIIKLPQETRAIILERWLKDSGVPNISSTQLEEISHSIGKNLPPSMKSLSKGWQISWDKKLIKLLRQSDKETS